MKQGEWGMHVSGQGKAPTAFRTITEVAAELDVPQHVLRFWEGRFPQIKPLKRGGGRRYYRPDDITLLKRIRQLLYVDGYTIRGVQKLLQEEGRNAASGGQHTEPKILALPFIDALPDETPESFVLVPPQSKRPAPSPPALSRRSEAKMKRNPPDLPPHAAVTLPLASLPSAKRDALWDILVELRALRGTLRR